MAEANRSIRTILNDALDIADPQERAAFIDSACSGDNRLRQNVEELLAAHDVAGRFLKVERPEGTTIRVAQITEKAGDRLGRYKLLQQIGEGGCGVVYMAEQEEPVRRRVALKVIKLGMDTRSVIARFEAERQALALMDHPNIARVFDAGATETGRPYFVMELVRGVRITDYCDQNKLSTHARLKLFTQVCSAIQHAHQKGIIHRDIKPSNILVTLHDGVPVPKVIDFGIAKATEQRLTDKTLFTAFEQFIGTPAYMSPEQAEMSGLDIDTRSDIYALGVLLYELLTGQTPFDPKELLQAGLDEMRKTIREKEPARPSTRLSTMLDADLTTVANRRQSDPPKLVHLLRGDLDWIVMKCLEKDRTRRYETANGLISDIHRHLNNEPVSAAAPSTYYKFQKFAQRNRVALFTASAIATILVVGAGISIWEAVRATRAERLQRELREQAQANERMAQAAQASEAAARRQAQANEEKAIIEASKSRQVAKFLKEMLAGVSPSVALGRDTQILREVLDKTSQRVGRDLKDQPAVEAEIRSSLGRVYSALGQYNKAETMLRDSARLYRMTYGPEHPELASSLVYLADVLSKSYNSRGNSSEAESLYREALAIQRKRLGEENIETADCLAGFGWVLYLRGKINEAESIARQGLALERKLRGPDDPHCAHCLNIIGAIYKVSKPFEAEKAFREAVRIVQKSGDEPTLAIYMNNLANALWEEAKLGDKAKYAEAERIYRESLALSQKLLGNDHPMLHMPFRNLAAMLRSEGKRSEADAVDREMMKIRIKAIPLTSDGAAGLLRPRDLATPPELLDLSKHYNADPASGWTDSNPENNLATLPTGVHEFGGIRFDARGIIQLSCNKAREPFPQQVAGIKIGTSCKRIHFLHAASTSFGTTNGAEIGRFVFHYAGLAAAQMPIRFGTDVRDWQMHHSQQPVGPDFASVVWKGTNGLNIPIQLFKSTWENPHPDAAIETFDYVSAMVSAAPFLIAATVEP